MRRDVEGAGDASGTSSSGEEEDRRWQREAKLHAAEAARRAYSAAASGAAAPPARRRPGKEPYDDVEPDAASAPRSKRAPLLLRRLERFLPPPLRFILHVSDHTTLVVLAVSLVLVVSIFAIHYRQEMTYWEELEGAVREERAARLDALAAVTAVQETASQKVLALESELARAGQPQGHSGGQVEASPCPEKECPPARCERLGAVGGGRGEGGVLVAEGPLEEWQPDFKVFVYDLPPEYHIDLKRDQKRCVNDQYGTEIMIHENLLQHPVRTLDPEEAEFFFVPIYPECYLFRENQRAGKDALRNTNRWFRSMLQIVTHQLPYWNRTQGRDHVFVFAGARGPHIFQDWKKHIKKSIFMTPEGDRALSEQFNTWKDIVIPGLENDKEFWSGKLRGLPLERRDIFAFFRGTIVNKGGSSYSKGIRIRMEAALRPHEDVVFAEQGSECNRQCYRDSMRKSVFCLCPRGWSPWTLRAYQAMMVGCIPVVIADEIEFPYENTMDWTQLTVKIKETDAERAYEILKAIPEETIRAKQAAIDRVWRTVAWQQPTSPGDAFHAVLRDLGRKRRNFKASSFTFWT